MAAVAGAVAAGAVEIVETAATEGIAGRNRG
jgi:hypothetical protein